MHSFDLLLECIFLLFLYSIHTLWDLPGGALFNPKKSDMHNNTKLISLVLFVGIISLLSSCDPQKRINKDYNYFQKGLDSINQYNGALTDLKLLPNDLISIQVIAGSLRQEDASLFNLSSAGSTSSSMGASTTSASGGVGYQIDQEGYIEMPKIGKIKAAGLTKVELAELLKNKLSDEVKNPLVIVKLTNLKANVLGEVKRPGVVNFKTDKANLFDAIAEAGDLTDAGKREDIVLLRQINGKFETYKIDLRNTAFIKTEAFQIHQNDVIYVAANDNKLKTLNVNPNFQRDISLGLAALSTLAIIFNTISIFRR